MIAAAQLMDMAEGGDPDAQYLMGKLYEDGPVLIPDSVEAQYWPGLSAQQGHVVTVRTGEAPPLAKMTAEMKAEIAAEKERLRATGNAS